MKYIIVIRGTSCVVKLLLLSRNWSWGSLTITSPLHAPGSLGITTPLLASEFDYPMYVSEVTPHVSFCVWLVSLSVFQAYPCCHKRQTSFFKAESYSAACVSVCLGGCNTRDWIAYKRRKFIFHFAEAGKSMIEVQTDPGLVRTHFLVRSWCISTGSSLAEGKRELSWASLKGH